jgi:alpha-beta hydrolase superfamily lysophospholipase
VSRLRKALPLVALLFLRCDGSPRRLDGFYVSPTKRPATHAEAVAERKPGKLIRSEPFATNVPGTQAWRILYVSTGLDGGPIEVSGLVIAPTLPPPLAGRNVVAWAHPTTGVAENCAPSLLKDALDTIPHLPALMALDNVVVATDYPGLGTPGPHPYLVGVSEGRAVLDSVRAARQIPKIGASTHFAAWGHSQGGHAVLFAGELAKEYAPELDLLGVAAIAPATELAQLLRDDLDERAGKVIVSYCLWSWSRVYGAPLDRFVEPAVLRAMDGVAGDCVENQGEAYRVTFATLPIPSEYLAPAIFTNTTWSRLLEDNRPGRAPAGAPVYVAQGTDDPIVRPSVTADFVAGLCRAGAVVRYEPFPGVGHMRAGRTSATSAIKWMQGRFAGERAPNTCPPL